MSGMPAYRYDHAMAQPSRYGQPAPSVRVVRGRKHSAYPTLSDFPILLIKVGVALLAVFLVIGFVRVALASAAYSTASEASSLRAQISDARTTGESLAVQESLLSSPSNIRTEAGNRLSMTSGSATETMTLSVDPVAIDSDGNLSLAQSVARLASQG